MIRGIFDFARSFAQPLTSCHGRGSSTKPTMWEWSRSISARIGSTTPGLRLWLKSQCSLKPAGAASAAARVCSITS